MGHKRNGVAHYTLSEGSVTGALLGDDGRSVVLTVAGASAEATLGISGIQDLFGNTIQPVDGLAVGAYPFGLAMWYRADAGVTLSGGDLVSEWADHSGHGNHGFQFTEDSMPLKVDGAINGLPVLRFDGVDDYLVVNHSESVAITGDMTIYAVARFNDFANFNGIVGKTAGPANNLPAPFDFYTLQGSGLPRFFRGNGEGIHSQVSGMIAPTPGQDHILSVIMTGTNVSHYLDGEPNGSGALATTIADAGGPMGIGTRMDLVTKMKGDFAEILIFSAGLSEADRLTVNAYLGAKYGIGLPPVSLAAGLSGGNVIISWPDVAGFVLESAGTLPSESWTEVTAEIEIVEGRRQVTIPAGAAQGYYRLIKP